MNHKTAIKQNAPAYCCYPNGQCQEAFSDKHGKTVFFAYATNPPMVARIIRDATTILKEQAHETKWVSWENLNVIGKVIFCEICKAIRESDFVVADITTLNFNVLFEIGYAIGLGKSIIPIKEKTIGKDKQYFEEIGFFDVLGYAEFTNSIDLASVIQREAIKDLSSLKNFDTNKKQPIYYLRAPIDTNEGMRITTELNKSSCPYRSFDVKETPRLSLYDALKEVNSSVSIVAHLLNSELRDDPAVLVHNARCAFVCGLALSCGKKVLMLQEGDIHQPIDYRDIIIPIQGFDTIARSISEVARYTAQKVYTSTPSAFKLDGNILDSIDIGSTAAENEIQSLADYFIKTPQFRQVKQGHARLVIGRKGAGKTALFYGIRGTLPKEVTVLDLKPEGHQFVKLKEMVLSKLTEGMQLHTLSAFWHYLLVIEIAKKIIERESRSAWRDQESLVNYRKIEETFTAHGVNRDVDFSERLMDLINRLVSETHSSTNGQGVSDKLTNMIYGKDINVLEKHVIEYQATLGNLWILFDNIDKGFATHGLSKEDILIVRGLLDASRKLQRELQKKQVDCITVMFIRRDVYDFLIDETPDRGKEPHVNLDWSDIKLMEQLILQRFKTSVPSLAGDFREIWHQLFDSHVGRDGSFQYILDHTLLRPRDLLNFVRKAIQVAASRDNNRVKEDDIICAESQYSEDMFNELKFELRDIYPEYADVLQKFYAHKTKLSKDDIFCFAMEANVDEKKWQHLFDVLIWFCFIGIKKEDKSSFAYMYDYSKEKINSIVSKIPHNERCFVVHPAFQKALEVN